MADNMNAALIARALEWASWKDRQGLDGKNFVLALVRALERLETLLRARDADVAEQVRTNVAINDDGDSLRAALEKMTFYAALLVDPAAHGTFSPDIAMADLASARAALAGEPA